MPYNDAASETVASLAVTEIASPRVMPWMLSSTSVASSDTPTSTMPILDEPVTSSACCMLSEARSSSEAIL